MEILGRRNNKYKIEYDKYLELKEGMPYKYNRFYELRQDYSFEEVLQMKHRKDKGGYGNGRLGYTKYDFNLSRLNIIQMYEGGYNITEICDLCNISYGKVRYTINLYKKRDRI